MDIKERIIHDFTYYAPTPDQVHKYTLLRNAAQEYALLIAELTPPGREQSLALTHVEESVMFANAAIARTAPRDQVV